MYDYTLYVEIAQAFAKMLHYGVYLLDKTTELFVYSSDDPLLRCGLTDDDLSKRGIKAFMEQLSIDDYSLIRNAYDDVVTKYDTMPRDQQSRFVAYLNFHTRYQNRLVMVTHKISVIATDSQGYPLLILGLVTPSPYDCTGFITARITGTDIIYHYHPDSRSWETGTLPHLTDNELTMLRLTIQGHEIKDIARLMFKSPESVKYYRRQVYDKLGVRNISEALSHAADYCLL